MQVILQNTLVESVKPGDDVMISGVLIQRWKPASTGCRPYLELAFEANNIEVLNKREYSRGNLISHEEVQVFKSFWKANDKIQGKKLLVESVCSNIYQREDIKLGMLLSLIGGISQKT